MAKPLSHSRLLFFRIFYPTYLVAMIGFAVAGAILFDLWWMFAWILFPVLQWVVMSPLHRAQILGRHRATLPDR